MRQANPISAWSGRWFWSSFLAVPLSLCGAALATEPNPVTFTEDVAPIVFNNCSSCHRPGEGAPFNLLNYRDVKKRGQLIRDVTSTGYMPPWPPALGWGHFQDERRLTPAQVATLKEWVATGMTEGPADKLPALPEFPAGGWSLGTPDLIVTLPAAFDIPADGRDIYRSFVLPLNINEDKWVTAIEIRPTARSVVHHALFFLDNTGAARKLDEADATPGFGRMGFPRTGTLGGWAVGATPRHLPMDLAYPLAKGSDLVVQMHFHPSGKAEREQTTFGLYFAKQAPSKRLMGTRTPLAFGFGTKLRTQGIKPGEKDFTIQGEWTAPFDVDVVSIGGHAHYLCTKMKAVAERPDGQEVKLFAIDDWDFNWQGRYNFVEPVRLPKGTIIRTTLVYDNSADNPRNPTDPPVHVRWGEGSTDEMGSVLFSYVAVKEADLASSRKSGMFGGGLGAGGGGNFLRNLTPARLGMMFDFLDADKDGKLSGDEVPDRLQPFQNRLDTNQDGAIDRDEIQKLIPTAAGRPGLLRDRQPAGATVDDPDPAPTPVPASTPALPDLQGRVWHPLRPEGDLKVHVLLFTTRDCPVANGYSQEIGRVARDYAARPVAFLLVHVDPDVTIADAREHAREYALDLPIFRDLDHTLVRATGVKVTPEAAVIRADGSIAYTGRIDDRYTKLGRQRPQPTRHDLRDALDAVLAGQAVGSPRVEAIGCPIADLAG